MNNFSNARLQIIERFEIPQLDRERNIRVYLPKGYYENSAQAYPVIYMHDGQNLFDGTLSLSGCSWEIQKNVDQFFKEGEGVIIVGIDNGPEYDGYCRMYEYSPWVMDQNFELPDWSEEIYSAGGQGRQYLDFITDTLKPYIDKNYNTRSDRENTVIAGSSMGGFISIFAALERPDVFAKAGVFSPAFWFNKPEMFNFLKEKPVTSSLQIYMDIGTQESSGRGINFEQIYLNDCNEAFKLLKDKERLELKYIVDEGAQHTESAWARRFPEMLSYLFSKS
jgi:predicted alpha/beta superfamily hydrolase